jgi:Terminase RNaseH-like domain
MSRALITAGIDDALHFTPEQRAEIIASYPAWERDARTKGVPTLGSGRVFPLPEEMITCDRREIPAHWRRIAALDFGWTHPTAAVELAHDLDTDCVFVVRTHRLKEASPIIHAATLRAWGRELRWSWPRDGNRLTAEGAGVALATQYRDLGLNMLHEYACYLEPNGQKSVSVEAGIFDMLTRMETGRFKVFKEHNDWFDEYRLFHRRDGKIVAEHEDLMAATRYAIMALRHASTVTSYKSFRRKLNYRPLGLV